MENIISDIKQENISGVNVTVPFKNAVIPYLDELSDEANKTQSVNTIHLKDKKVNISPLPVTYGQRVISKKGNI